MIYFEDDEILVCHKPAGIPVQSARTGQKDMISILNNYLAGIPQSGQAADIVKRADCGICLCSRNTHAPGIYIVHRIDQPVEGILVFAKTKRAASELNRQFTEGSISKVYRAVCCRNLAKASSVKRQPDAEGMVINERFELVDYLVRDGRTNTSFTVEKGRKDAKRAELSFWILDRKTVSEVWELVLAEISLKTGRHHQIRVQMAHAGLPLAGDRKYHPDWAAIPGANELKNAALCAVRLTLRHPVTGTEMTFETQPESQIFAKF